MSGIAEFTDRTQFPEAVEASFTADMAVVRGVLSASDIENLDPQLGNQLTQQISVGVFVGMAINRAIPRISEARRLSRQWMLSHLGRPSVVASAGTIRPNLFRNGGIETHIDKRDIVSATSVNLTNGRKGHTIFYAERIADFSRPFDDMVDDFRAWRAVYSEPDYSVELGQGDVVVISRGVVHKVDATVQRQTLLMATRSLFVP